MKKNNLRNLFDEIENSSTITSEHAMYKNDPAARHENTISVISLDYCSINPRMTPTGVKRANIIIIVVTNLCSSGNVLAILIPRDIPAAPLWRIIANANISTF